MGEEEIPESYPLKSLHDFLTELDKEWDKFRTGSLLGIVTSGVLFVFLALRFLGLISRIRRLKLPFAEFAEELLFLILVTVFMAYGIYLLLGQYRFFKKWERRVGLLLHLEERLMGEIDRKEIARSEDSGKVEKRGSE